jgi:CRISPR-associated protein Csm1
MSLQVFLQAQLLGSEEFLLAQSAQLERSAADLTGRCSWLGLLCEVLPRALLAELKLSRMLLGSSSAEQFLLVLAEEDIPKANEFLGRAADAVNVLSGNTLRLVWASTENLGSWPVARKRLDEALLARVSAPISTDSDRAQAFVAFSPIDTGQDSYFADFAAGLTSATCVGWSPDRPAHLMWNTGEFVWTLKEQSAVEDDGILFLRRFALNDEGTAAASPADLAGRAEGSARWGILRGDVDQFDEQLRRAPSVEDHIQLSMLFKEFFAGELPFLLFKLPDLGSKVSILYRGGDDFIVIGAWDALVVLGRELQRLFEIFVEQNMQALPSLEGKSISMSLAIAPGQDDSPSDVLKTAGEQLRAAKATEPDTFFLFGRNVEWKRLSDAEELKTGLLRLVNDFGFPPDYIHDLASVYREAFTARAMRRSKPVRVDKPWRTYMRVSRVIPQGRGKEAAGLRSSLISNLIGKRTAGLKLRPSARVGLEWARLAAGD